MPKKQKIDLDKEIKTAGWILIVLGFIHFLLPEILWSMWGVVLIGFGVISLFYRAKKMILIFGIILVFVGLMNSSTIFFYEDGSIFWFIFGLVQIVWGVQEIIKYGEIKENPKYRKRKRSKNKNLILLNKISGWIVIVSGTALIFIQFLDYSSEFVPSHIFAGISGIAFIFLGTYVLKFERWAIILSGVGGVVSIINSWIISLFIFGNFGGFIGFLTGIPSYVLILNWILMETK